MFERNVDKLTTDTKKKKLKELCRTRWVERHDAFEVFIELFPAIIETLEHFALLPSTRKPGMPSASDLLNAVLKFEFIITLLNVHKCLSYLRGLSKSLQDSGLEIAKALQQIDVVKGALNDSRTGVDEFHSAIHTRAVKMCEEYDIDVKIPRLCKRQTMRNNVPISDVDQYYRVAVTTKFLDYLNNEMNDRFSDMHMKVAMSVKVIPAYMKEMPSSSDFTFFSEDIESECLLDTELHQWYRKWKDVTEKPKSVEDTLSKCDEDFYPNIKSILRICGCFPVTSCECERSISIMRLLKTYLRSTMGQDRLTGLAMMYIHRDIDVNTQDIVREFSRVKPQRILLPDILFCNEGEC